MIKIEGLNFSYGTNAIICDLSIDIKAGSFLAIAGPNGAGKSTLLNLIGGDIKADKGSVRIEDREVSDYSAREIAQKIAVVRQEFVPSFAYTVFETVMMARTMHFNSMGFESKRDRQIVNDALEATDTAQFASRQLGQISGGERQRVFIARALAQDTPILLLDEPTSALDLQHQVRIYDLLKELQAEHNKTILAISHDVNLASQYCRQALLISGDGKYYSGVPGEVFSAENLQRIFGVSGFSGKIGSETFFLPLGKHASFNQDSSDKSL